jgi:hypothetical protein
MAVFLQQVLYPTLTKQQLAGIEAVLMVPSKVYTSIPGVNVPGVREPQLLHIDFSSEHNCITSKPLTAVTTAKLELPKFTPLHGLAGKPEPAGTLAPRKETES